MLRITLLIFSGVLPRQLSGKTEHSTEAQVEALAAKVANLIVTKKAPNKTKKPPQNRKKQTKQKPQKQNNKNPNKTTKLWKCRKINLLVSQVLSNSDSGFKSYD